MQSVVTTDPFAAAPRSVRTIRVLGHGRAAQARLVAATMADGTTITCVEKVFCPGWLTRTLYRLSFQSPFAYQSNRAAIATCFFRRRVAATVLAMTDTDVDVAMPIYVRFDSPTRSWVLAAQWCRGRGIRPQPADPERLRRRSLPVVAPESVSEVDQLVATMRVLESQLVDSGLIGSGWQVAPRAMVSTANLLRVVDGPSDHYTVIDLESGIPAVLVPKYILLGIARGAIPPFDDLDAERLHWWVAENEIAIADRMGKSATTQLRSDVDALVAWNDRWKSSELALLRHPMMLASSSGRIKYAAECRRRWDQDGITEDATGDNPVGIQFAAVWMAGLMPGSIGRFAARCIGDGRYRSQAIACLVDREMRDQAWTRWTARVREKLIDENRIDPSESLSRSACLLHAGAAKVLSAPVHRLVTHRAAIAKSCTTAMLLVFHSGFQTWYGTRMVGASIDRWQSAGRIEGGEADGLRNELLGDQIATYIRGFSIHVSLKALGFVFAPAKVGGVITFLLTGNPLFLLPLVLMPILRLTVVVASAWRNRHRDVPHGEAMLVSALPVIGLFAFPLQMFAKRPELSTFLIRDTASALGRRLPIYGGADSRTEMALIRAADALVLLMQLTSSAATRVTKPTIVRGSVDQVESSNTSGPVFGPTLGRAFQMTPATRSTATPFRRWLNEQATLRMSQTDPALPTPATRAKAA